MPRRRLGSVALALFALIVTFDASAQGRPRARDAGIAVGVMQTGPLNAITDVGGVRVGHVTLIEGRDIRTGAIVEWARIDGAITELYDVAVLQGILRPSVIGFKTDEIKQRIAIER